MNRIVVDLFCEAEMYVIFKVSIVVACHNLREKKRTESERIVSS
jgi:hypothetical protein